MTKPVALVVTCDKTYLNPMYVFLHSLKTKGNLDDSAFNLYLYTSDIELEDINYCPFENLSIVKCDTTVYENMDVSGLNIHQQNPEFISAAALRLRAMEQLRDKYSTMVYFDCDIMINGDVSELFTLLGDKPEYALAAAKDGAFEGINSGVLVCNLDHIAFEGIHDNFLESKIGEQFDQTFLTEYLAADSIFELDHTYNPIPNYYTEDQEAERISILNSKVHHYALPAKPWDLLLPTLTMEQHTIKELVKRADQLAYEFIPFLLLPYEEYFEAVMQIMEYCSPEFVLRTSTYHNAKLRLLSARADKPISKEGKVIYSALNRDFLESYKEMMHSLHINGNVPEDVSYAVFSPDITPMDLMDLPMQVRVCVVEDKYFGKDEDGKPFQNCILKIDAIQKLVEDYGQALYLDSDIVIKGDISYLLEDMGQYDLRAALEFPYSQHYDMSTSHFSRVNEAHKIHWRHFNSGVMAINLNTAPCFVGTPGDIPTWRDQEWLNQFYKEANIEILPIEYNWKPEEYGKLPVGIYNQHIVERDKCRILHFAGKAKPGWNKDSTNPYAIKQLEGLAEYE